MKSQSVLSSIALDTFQNNSSSNATLNQLFNTQNPNLIRCWLSILNFLDISDATALALMPGGNEIIHKYISEQKDRVTLINIGLSPKFKKLNDDLQRLHDVQLKKAVDDHSFMMACMNCFDYTITHRSLRILIPLAIVAVVVWQGAVPLYQIDAGYGNEYDNELDGIVQVSQDIFNSFVSECSYVDNPANLAGSCGYTGGLSDHKYCCTTDFLVDQCEYEDYVCATVTNLMMNCSLSLWANFTSNCDAYQNLNSPGASYAIEILTPLMLALTLFIAYKLYRKWPMRTVYIESDFSKEWSSEIDNLQRPLTCYLENSKSDSLVSEVVLKKSIFHNDFSKLLSINQITRVLDKKMKRLVNDVIMKKHVHFESDDKSESAEKLLQPTDAMLKLNSVIAEHEFTKAIKLKDKQLPIQLSTLSAGLFCPQMNIVDITIRDSASSSFRKDFVA